MKTALTLHFSSSLYMLKDWLIFRLPEEASKQLPSRGQVAVEGTINGHEIRTVLEPDGNWGHWLRIDDTVQQAIDARAGDIVECELMPTKNWPEPKVPEDIADALQAASRKVQDKWKDITPMARWEWVRWIHSTGNPATRQIRIEKTISKLDGKHRRPCCFNLSGCTEPYVAKNGQLIGVA